MMWSLSAKCPNNNNQANFMVNTKTVDVVFRGVYNGSQVPESSKIKYLYPTRHTSSSPLLLLTYFLKPR